jgi:type I restriction enzyme S subunit
MNKKWPMVKLGRVLRLDLDRVPVDGNKSYPMVGVLSFGRGLFNRDPIENGKTSYRFFYRLKANHIVMSQLFGWEGALALSSEKFAGKYLSPQFPTFITDETKLHREFLGWFIRRPIFWENLGSRASGMGDRRRTLNPEALFACEIPLPPLSEQRRIVSKIDQLAARIQKAHVLRQQAVEEADAFVIAVHISLAGKRSRKLCDILELREDKVPVSPNQDYPQVGVKGFGGVISQTGDKWE